MRPTDPLDKFVNQALETSTAPLADRLRRISRNIYETWRAGGGLLDDAGIYHAVQSGMDKFLSEDLKALVVTAAEHGRGNVFVEQQAGIVKRERPGLRMVLIRKASDPTGRAMWRWAKAHTDEIAKGLTRQQARTLRSLLHEASRQNVMTAQEFMERMSDALGLTERDAVWAARSLVRDRENGLGWRSAQKKSKARIEAKTNQRAKRILDWSLSTSWNKGILEDMKARLLAGEVDRDVEKVWITNRDDRVCTICRPLERTALSLDESFESGDFVGESPPAHIGCRCVLAYKRRPLEDRREEEEDVYEEEHEGLPIGALALGVGALMSAAAGSAAAVTALSQAIEFPDVWESFVAEGISADMLGLLEPHKWEVARNPAVVMQAARWRDGDVHNPLARIIYQRIEKDFDVPGPGPRPRPMFYDHDLAELMDASGYATPVRVVPEEEFWDPKEFERMWDWAWEHPERSRRLAAMGVKDVPEPHDRPFVIAFRSTDELNDYMGGVPSGEVYRDYNGRDIGGRLALAMDEGSTKFDFEVKGDMLAREIMDYDGQPAIFAAARLKPGARVATMTTAWDQATLSSVQVRQELNKLGKTLEEKWQAAEEVVQELRDEIQAVKKGEPWFGTDKIVVLPHMLDEDVGTPSKGMVYMVIRQDRWDKMTKEGKTIAQKKVHLNLDEALKNDRDLNPFGAKYAHGEGPKPVVIIEVDPSELTPSTTVGGKAIRYNVSDAQVKQAWAVEEGGFGNVLVTNMRRTEHASGDLFPVQMAYLDAKDTAATLRRDYTEKFAAKKALILRLASDPGATGVMAGYDAIWDEKRNKLHILNRNAVMVSSKVKTIDKEGAVDTYGLPVLRDIREAIPKSPETTSVNETFFLTTPEGEQYFAKIVSAGPGSGVGGPAREVAARAVADVLGYGHLYPKTRQTPMGRAGATGVIQEMLSDVRDTWQWGKDLPVSMWPKDLKGRTMLNGSEQEILMRQIMSHAVKSEDVRGIAMLEWFFGHQDRHGGNYLLRWVPDDKTRQKYGNDAVQAMIHYLDEPPGQWQMIAIDNESAFMGGMNVMAQMNYQQIVNGARNLGWAPRFTQHNARADVVWAVTRRNGVMELFDYESRGLAEERAKRLGTAVTRMEVNADAQEVHLEHLADWATSRSTSPIEAGSRGAPVLIKEGREALPGDEYVWVFHATDDATADAMLRQGVDAVKGAAPMKVKPGKRAVEPMDVLANKVPKGEKQYVYHATGIDRLEEIRRDGFVEIFEPPAVTTTRTGTWPDGSMARRSWWSEHPSTAAAFAPTHSERAVVVRRMRDDLVKADRDRRGHYMEHRAWARELEYLGEDGDWYPLYPKQPLGVTPEDDVYARAIPGFGELPETPPPGYVRLYRGASPDRLDIRGGNPMEGRWFTTSYEDAVNYANLNFEGGWELSPGRAIVAVDVPEDKALAMLAERKPDGRALRQEEIDQFLEIVRNRKGVIDPGVGDSGYVIVVDDLTRQQAVFFRGSEAIALRDLPHYEGRLWFHGSPETDLKAVSIERTARGLYTTNDYDQAKFFAGEKGRVYPVVLRADNVANLDDPEVFETVAHLVYEGEDPRRRRDEVRAFAQKLFDEYNKDGIEDPTGKLTEQFEALHIPYDVDDADEIEWAVEEITDILANEEDSWRWIPKAWMDEFDRIAPPKLESLEEARRAYGTEAWYLHKYQDEFVEAARELGYDAVDFTDMKGGGGTAISRVVFEPEQIQLLTREAAAGPKALHIPEEAVTLRKMRDSGHYDIEFIGYPTVDTKAEYLAIPSGVENLRPVTLGAGTRREKIVWVDEEFVEWREVVEGEGGVLRRIEIKPKFEVNEVLPAQPSDDIIWRGMSREELESIIRTGEIRSKGIYNLGEDQVGLTYFSPTPRSAQSYATGFAPNHLQPTPDRPAYVVGIRRPPASRTRVAAGTGGDEVGVTGAIPRGEIVEVYEGRVVYTEATKLDVINDAHGIRDGSFFGGSSRVYWKGVEPDLRDIYVSPEAERMGTGLVGAHRPIPMDEASRMKRASQQGYTRDAYHGTLRMDFSRFSSFNNNADNYYGKGHYFTSGAQDASANYANTQGADIQIRIQQRLDDLIQEILYDQSPDYWDEEMVKQLQDYHHKLYGVGIDRDDLATMDLDDMRQGLIKYVADQMMIDNAGRILPVRLRMENPVYVNHPTLKTMLTYGEPYDPDLDEYLEPEGSLVDFIENIRWVLGDTDANQGLFEQDVVPALVEAAMDEGGAIPWEEAERIVREEMYSISFWDEPDAGLGEVLNQVAREMGFDGFDMDASVFWMPGTSGQRHYIVFDSKQIRSRFDPFVPHVDPTMRTATSGAGLPTMEYVTGRGLSPGVYVGATIENLPPADRYLAFRIPARDLLLSEEAREMGYRTPIEGLWGQGAVVNRQIHRTDVFEVGTMGISQRLDMENLSQKARLGYQIEGLDPTNDALLADALRLNANLIAEVDPMGRKRWVVVPQVGSQRGRTLMRPFEQSLYFQEQELVRLRDALPEIENLVNHDLGLTAVNVAAKRDQLNNLIERVRAGQLVTIDDVFLSGSTSKAPFGATDIGRPVVGLDLEVKQAFKKATEAELIGLVAEMHGVSPNRIVDEVYRVRKLYNLRPSATSIYEKLLTGVPVPHWEIKAQEEYQPFLARLVRAAFPDKVDTAGHHVLQFHGVAFAVDTDKGFVGPFASLKRFTSAAMDEEFSNELAEILHREVGVGLPRIDEFLSRLADDPAVDQNVLGEVIRDILSGTLDLNELRLKATHYGMRMMGI
jgi:hypothetical protein